MNLSIIHHLGEPNSAFSLESFYIFQKQLQDISKTKSKEEVAKLVKYNTVIFLNSSLKLCYFMSYTIAVTRLTKPPAARHALC